MNDLVIGWKKCSENLIDIIMGFLVMFNWGFEDELVNSVVWEMF